MSGERSRPNLVAQKKYEAIKYWDQEARQRIKEGKYIYGFGNWTMKQLAKAHAESWLGLALDVLSIGSGKLLVKGVQSGARAIKGAKAVQSAKTMMEIDRTLKPVRKAYGITRPIAKTRHKVLEGVGKAAETIEDIAPKYIKPVTVAGTKIATPRRVLKASSSIGRGIKTELGLKQVKEESKHGIPGAFQPRTKITFPSEVVTRSWPYKSGFDINKLFQQPSLSRRAQEEIMRKGIYVPGVWGTEVGRSRPGFGINKLQQPPLSKQLEREIMQKGLYVPGVWGTEVGRSRPGFDINKLQQPLPSKQLEREIMRKGLYVPGVWGMEITRSRPTPNPLREMSRGLR